MADFTLSDLSGGMNDFDAPIAVPEDQCLVAENVELVRSPLGERRKGASAVTIAGSGLETKTDLAFLYRHLPTADETGAQLWAFAVTAGVASQLAYKDTAWHSVVPADAITITGTTGFKMQGQTFKAKLFLAYKSTVDRLHVWDGTSLRRVGLAQPSAAPTAADTGVGTFSGTRYYRVRETIQVAGVTTRRSEPSVVLTKAPSGAGTGLVVTKPVDMGEGATHWELEASVNNADFYRIATTIVGTATATDSQSFSVGYATMTGAVLSETVGNYTVPISAKFVSVDNDRLILGGSHEQAALGSRVSWTTVSGDITGVGNDERVPLATNNFLDLDSYEGGALTAQSGSINGYVYLMKSSHVYRLVRTGTVSKAYEAYSISKTRGALENSLAEGTDQSGNPALFFLDPKIGPCMIGKNGLQHCGMDIFTTWARVNINATSVVTSALFYPDNHQVIWWIAVDGGNTPTLKVVLHTLRMRDRGDGTGLRRGFTTGTGSSATAISSCLFASNIESNAARSLTLRPFIGRGGGTAAIMQLDTGTTDNAVAYYGRIVTRPASLAGLLNKFGIMAAGVLAKAASGITLYLKLISDMGVDSVTKSTSLTPVGSETHVMKPLDNLAKGGMYLMQLQYGDDPDGVAVPAGTWEISVIALKPDVEETA